jgi:hypothetical protein
MEQPGDAPVRVYDKSVGIVDMRIEGLPCWRPDPSKPKGTFIPNYYYLQSIVGWSLSL